MVRTAYPKAFAIDWQGVWRVYKEDLLYNSRLTFSGSDSEEEAWAHARELVEEEKFVK
jgi:hypothetical protein